MKSTILPGSIILSFALYCQTNLFAQNNGNSNGNNEWKTNGNNADTSQFIGTMNTQPLVFKTSGTEQLRVDEGGNVGVGTDSPEYKLDVEGDARFRAQVYMPNLNTTGELNSTSNILFSNEVGGLVLGNINQMSDIIYDFLPCEPGPIANPKWSNGENKIFVACPQVNVGIGTYAPAHKLHVDGSTYNTGTLGLGIEPSPNAQLRARTTASIGICIDHDYTQDYGYAFKAIIHDEETKGIGIFSDIYNKDVFTMYGSGKMVVSNQTADILTLENNGKFTISNGTEKTFQLESNGLLRGRQIKLDLDTWADYVFDDYYELMPLDAVETFIAKEKHLPNVPSEEEILEDGVDLGGMNVVLLEKVEELTLYLIEQNKKIEELQKELEELKKESVNEEE